MTAVTVTEPLRNVRLVDWRAPFHRNLAMLRWFGEPFTGSLSITGDQTTVHGQGLIDALIP